MNTLSMSHPVVAQSQLARVRQAQVAFAPKHVLLSEALNSYRDELLGASVLTGPIAANLALYACPFVAHLKYLEEVQQNLNDTLQVCGGRCAEGTWQLQTKTGLVLRKGRNANRRIEDRLVQFCVSTPPHLVAIQKQGAGPALWVSSNFFNYCELSPIETIGKAANQIWPGKSGGPIIRRHELKVWNEREPRIDRELLVVRGKKEERLAIRFVAPDSDGNELLWVVCFDRLALMDAEPWCPTLLVEGKRRSRGERAIPNRRAKQSQMPVAAA